MVIFNILYQLKEISVHIIPAVLLSGLIFSFSSCSSRMNDDRGIKFNPALKQKIMEAEQNNPDELIPVLVKSSEELTGDMIREVENTGIKVESVIGDIFAANGTSKQLKQAAQLPYIINLELSQKREIN